MFKIYALTYNNRIVYIGQTTMSLTRRKYTPHYNIPYPKRDISIHLIEVTEDVSRERYWIELFRSMGFPLLNRRNGDTGTTDRKEYDRIRKKEYYRNQKLNLIKNI